GAGLDPALAALAAACFLATLLNPYHFRLYGVVWEYATQPGPYQLINELKAPEFRDVTSWATLALAAAALFALGRRRPLGSFEVLCRAGAAVLALRARRDLWLLALAALTVLATARRSHVALADRFAWTRGRLAALALGAAASVLLVWLLRGPTAEQLTEQVR